MKKRLDLYVSQTKPLVDYYNDWAEASGNGQQKAPPYEKSEDPEVSKKFAAGCLPFWFPE